MGKGILEMLNDAAVVDDDPSKGVTVAEIVETMVAMSKIKPRKPEYILSRWEAENLPLWQLNWLGENYIVLTSLEVHNIVREREKQSIPESK